MKAALFALTVIVSLYVASARVEVKCPESVNDDYILIPHPCDCTTYFVCLGYEPIPMPCPRGLYFDKVTQRCQWKNKVHCVIDPGCSSEILSQNEAF